MHRPLFILASAACCLLCGIVFVTDGLTWSTHGAPPAPAVRIWNSVSVPYDVMFGVILLLAGAFLVMPALWIWGRARAARKEVLRLTRLRDGLCPECGYDLRASRDRCPECGAPIPSHTPQAELRKTTSLPMAQTTVESPEISDSPK